MNQTEVKLDGIWGGSASYQGSLPVLVSIIAKGIIKPNRIGEPEAGQGTEGGRFTGSTDDSGPTKPGNRAEDKTLKTWKLWVL